MREAALVVDRVLLYDNSDEQMPFALIADGRPEKFTTRVDPLPTWAVSILGPSGSTPDGVDR